MRLLEVYGRACARVAGAGEYIGQEVEGGIRDGVDALVEEIGVVGTL